MAEQDFMAQVRALNPDLKDYDDTTLAATIADQHPDYKPALAKYLHPASADLAAQGAQTASQAPAEFAAHPNVSLGEALQTPPHWLTGAAADVRNPVLGGAADFLSKQITPQNAMLLAGGASNPFMGKLMGGMFGAAAAVDTIKSVPDLWRLYQAGEYDKLERLMTEKGLGGLAGFLGLRHGLSPEAPAMVPDTVAKTAATATEKAAPVAEEAGPETAEAAKTAAEAQQSVAEKQLVPEEPAETEGPPIVKTSSAGTAVVDPSKLGEAAATGVRDMGGVLRVSFRSPTQITPEQVESMFPDSHVEAQRMGADPLFSAGQQVFHVNFYNKYGALDYAASKAAEAQLGGGFYNPRTEQKAVQTSSGKVIPNPPASEYTRDILEDAIRRTGGDPSDPQQVADLQASLYGVKKPVNVTSVGDVPVSESSETPHDYQIDLADNDPSKVTHEMQHIRVQEGQIPSVPEGPGANDQISGQVAQDLTGQPKYAANINLNRLAIPGEAKQAILDYADQVVRQQPIPLDQTKADAAALGLSLEDVAKLPQQSADLAKQFTAARQIEAATASSYAKARQVWQADPSAPGSRQAASTALRAMLSTMQAASDVAANVGRALGAGNINVEGVDPRVAGMTDLVREIQKKGPLSQEMEDMLLDTDLGNALNRQKLRTALSLDDAAGADKTASLRQKLGYYYLSNILSGLPTMAIKASSDAVNTALSPFLEAAGAAAHGKPLQGLAEGGARAAGLAGSLNDAMGAFAQAWAKGSAVFGRPSPITGPARFIVPPSLKLLGAINDAFHTMNLRGELYSRGIQEAADKGLPASQWFGHAKAFADNPTPEVLNAAELEARKSTLTQAPGPILSTALQLRKAAPGAFLAAPIVTVPTNLVKMGFEMSPFGGAKVLADAIAGKPISNQTAGRAVLGSMVWAWAFNQAMQGRLHGSGPADYAQNQALKKANWTPDSYTLPNGQQFPVKVLGPLGFSLTTAANLAEVIQEAPRSPGLQQAITAAGIHMGRTVLDYPMLRGIHDLMDVIGNPAKAGQMIAGNVAGGMIPYSSMLARAAAAQDPYQRKVADAVDVLKSRIPFYRESVPPKYDFMGQPLPAPGSAASRFAWPGSPADVTESPTQRIAATAGIEPNPTTITLRGSHLPPLKLTPEDASQLEQMAGENVKKVFDRLDRAPSQLEAMPPAAQQEMIRKIISGSRAAASDKLQGMMARDGRLKAYMAQAGIASANKAQLNPYAVDLAVPGADKAEDMLNRFGIANSGSPANIPPDLAGQYQRELQVARSQLFQPYYANPSGIGSLPFERGRAIIQKLDDAAQALAAKQTLARANLKSKAAASAAQ